MQVRACDRLLFDGSLFVLHCWAILFFSGGVAHAPRNWRLGQRSNVITVMMIACIDFLSDAVEVWLH